MKQKSVLLLIFLGGWLLLRPFPIYAQSPTPAQTAEQIRSALFAAQMGLAEADTAAAKVAAAQAAYGGDFAATLATAAPAADQQIQAGLAAAATAVAATDAPALAAARAQVWTGILAGGYRVTTQAIAANDATLARQWLPVREFRQATRFSRPNADATLALAALGRGEIAADEALLAVEADVLDTYQARLNEALQELETAVANQFTIRQAELAALAQGYFAILAPAYGAQRGDAAVTQANVALAALQTAALHNEAIDAEMAEVTAVLHNFRAAPLSPDDQVRRAGQLLRFLALVPVEYERGVSGGTVTRELEIQEAVTFRDGAAAAFTDLQNLLDEIDPAQTAAAAYLQQLGDQLNDTATRTTIHDPAVIAAGTEETLALLQELLPADWQKGSNDGDFDVIASLLDQMETAVAANEYALAESARLEAYAMLEIGPEARLIAFAPQAIPPLEDLFWNGQGDFAGLAYLIRNEAPLSTIQASRAALDDALAEAQAALTSGSAPAVVATNAGIIVFREGLEAVLILASLMASFKAAERRHLRRPMWVGAGLAFVASIITWIVAQELLTTLARYGERLEAVVSLIAIAVLLLITNWFFHKVYWTGWMANFHTQKQRLLGAQASLWLGLMTLGFTSIYREGFESVLFLQALVLEGGTAVVLSGVALGLLGTFLVGVVVFALQARLPYRKMLIFTGILIGFVLLVMVGHTAHVWQVVGWLPLHPIRALQLPHWAGTWLGIFPTWEGLALQLAAAVFVIGS
ncbi:MAG: FTR1 family protein [Chloroflexota bacterium]